MAEVIKIHNYMIAANTYILLNESTKEAVVIDPSFGPEKIISCFKEEGLTCVAVLLTHGHFDHISGIDVVRKETGAKVYVSEKDAEMLTSIEKNLSGDFGLPSAYQAADVLLKGGETLALAGMEIQVLSTPGHTPGGLTFLAENFLFTGDTLFQMSVGRTDLPGGSYEDLVESLKKLKALDKDYIVYPGHEASTSLFHEIELNPFMKE